MHVVASCWFIALFLTNDKSMTHETIVSGLLGSITKTAEVSECPGKCLHTLVSKLCEEVRDDIPCPGAAMKCCVDRRSNDNKDTVEATTKRQTIRTPPTRRTTTTTTTTATTTTARPIAVASDKQDKFGDYEYTDSDDSDTSSASRFLPSAAFLVCLFSISLLPSISS